MIIYLVTGSCGEYDDRRDWNVKAFSKQSDAEKHVELAQTWASTIKPGLPWWDVKSPYDPDYKTDFGGTFYDFEPVELTLELD